MERLDDAMSSRPRGIASVASSNEIVQEPSADALPAALHAGDAPVQELSVTELKFAPKGRSSRRVRSQRRSTKDVLADGAIVIGRLAGLDPAGAPLVDHPLNASGSPLPSRTTVFLGPDRVGHDLALGFEGGDPAKPIVLGVIYRPDASAGERPDRRTDKAAEVKVDGERVLLSAEKEIVLRCGDASLTLTRAGKVLIRGEYILTRSSGVNRIKGGSVQIN